MTPRQLECLRFIDARIRETGVCPSYEEMQAAIGLKSKSGIHRLVAALEERGYIRRLSARARAIEVIRLPDAARDDRDALIATLSAECAALRAENERLRRGAAA